MFAKKSLKARMQQVLLVGLGLVLALNAFFLPPRTVQAAPAPLPGPSNPLIYDDFEGGGVFKQNWMNWWNQDGGVGTFSKTTEDGRSIGVFAQTPESGSSWAKFQPWNETVNLTGYRYINVSLKNPGYENALIRILINDGSRDILITEGWAPVPDDWTTLQLDLDVLEPAVDKRNMKFEIWLRQTGGSYGEIWVDDITATTASSGTAPTLTGTGVTANTDGVYNQNTVFTFAATYTDADNEAPFAMQIVLDDQAYDMLEVDYGDTTYTDGKAYTYSTQLSPGAHSYYFRATDLTSDGVETTLQSGLNVIFSEQVIDVVVSQAGYSAGDYKNAKVVSSLPLIDTSYEVLDGSTVIASGNLIYEGVTWNKHVYAIDFSSVTSTGSAFTIKSNGISSYPFPIQTNIWDSYKDEMTAFYRIQRAGVATSEAYPPGYSSIAPSAKVYHPAGHLDDGVSEDGTQQYDLVGGWYDAGDYGQYGGNQWVGAQIALAYLRYAEHDSVKYDNDGNGIPDLVDEAIFGSEYLVKFANQLGGQMFNLKNNASFIHPHKSTDNIPGTADDRKLVEPGVGGSAKSAGTLAATARAIYAAIAEGDVDPAKIVELEAFAAECEAAAVIFYEYAAANPNEPVGSYTTRGGLPNSMLLAEVQLYLLTDDTDYRDAAVTQINGLSFEDLFATNYWDMRPMSMAEIYPHVDPVTQAHIQHLLKQQVDFFLSSTDDTPYGVLNQFKNFGVNEPHVSYLGDLLRYYELFGDPAALRAVLKGMYWVFGENPWNISWVSGIGANHVKFLHTRLDEQANSPTATGIVIPGAMVSGPNMKDPKNKKSVSPWYEDRSLHQDDVNQWRYNEYSVSIQVGLLYTIMGLSTLDNASSEGGVYPAEVSILSPIIGDYVRGQVTVLAAPAPGLVAMDYSSGGSYSAMTPSGSAYAGTIDESASNPYVNRRIDVRGTDAAGNHTYSSTHYTVAQPLPDPSTPLLYDDFGGNGLWGAAGGNNSWVNWYTQNGGSATFARTTEDGRTVGKFTQTPSSDTSNAKFQPWHDIVDLSGYRYVNFTVKNAGYPDLRMRIEMSDGTRTYNLTGGWASVPNDWTELQFDLDALVPVANKSEARFSVWLNQSSGSYGEMFIDEIKAVNVASGSAPVLTNAGVDLASGDTETEFTFSVTYTDADNEAPFALELVLNGVIHHMEPVDPGDTTYTDGKDYTYTTRLPIGVHSYYFHTTDTSSDAVSTSVLSGPVVSSGSNILFFDDFEDGNADGWTPTSGTWTVQSGAYSGQAGSLNSYSVAGDANWTDYTLEAKVNVTNNSGGNKDAGLVFRYTDADNHYVLLLKNNDRSGRKMELVKVVGGVKTTLTFKNASVVADTFHSYKIVLNGDDIEVYKDDILELSATDSAHSGGLIGARVYANTKALFDDIKVTL